MSFSKMARNNKKRLAIFVTTSTCIIYAEAKYCSSEMPGEIKYYECLRTEYCCTFGCCVSPGQYFHQLWYYWILVIFMFLLCSGGGWWYRYWLQGRYRAAASTIPSRSSTTRSQTSIRNTPYQAQRARITYNSARNTVLLHRMKGPQRNIAAPPYNNNATTSGHYQNMNVVLNDATNCPYYQLYGPPPSYESVMAQTRGKMSTPASPESTAARLNLQSPNVITNPSVSQCLFYSCDSPARLVNDSSNQCSSDIASCHQHDALHQSVPFAHYSQYCTGAGATSQNMCIPLEYPEESLASGGVNFSHSLQNRPQRLLERLSDMSDAETYEVPNRETTLNGPGREYSPWHVNNSHTALKVHSKIEQRSPPQRCAAIGETRASSSKSEESESENEAKCMFFATQDNISTRERTNHRGSLRLPRKHNGGGIYQSNSFPRDSPKDLPSSHLNVFDFTSKSTSENAPPVVSTSERADAVTSPSQSNPSNNVILESFIFENARSSPLYENVTMNRSTNFDLESKHKLDRSKSLD
ncbi:uncharacterized protein LOC109853076 [Pseudomyrmex gracilis]|uniref:uncharacterized protein LOC109853076 n=1 Tax=Pseudomyrmex gracilis TaxID=219809 RepID=UPI0009957599|nr:uncharacterized protein LOC109853076 [Pseudomyrmex gracilis]